MIHYIINSLEEIKKLLSDLSNAEYSSECAFLSNATIGQHTRHIIELFQCLENGYEIGEVDYDNRKRNNLIETDQYFAISQISTIQNQVSKSDKPFLVINTKENYEKSIHSSYQRELLYNLEHCIHHQALIKVAVLHFPHIKLSKQFGVAPSTLQYRLEQEFLAENN